MLLGPRRSSPTLVYEIDFAICLALTGPCMCHAARRILAADTLAYDLISWQPETKTDVTRRPIARTRPKA